MSMTKKTVRITDDFNENINEVSKIVIFALKKLTSKPHLSADSFIVRLRQAVREKVEKL